MIMKTTNRRLSDLEHASGGKRGYVVLYANPHRLGEYTERSPWTKNPGKRFTEEEKLALADKVQTLVIVEYVKDWRPTTERSGKID